MAVDGDWAGNARKAKAGNLHLCGTCSQQEGILAGHKDPTSELADETTAISAEFSYAMSSLP